MKIKDNSHEQNDDDNDNINNDDDGKSYNNDSHVITIMIIMSSQ